MPVLSEEQRNRKDGWTGHAHKQLQAWSLHVHKRPSTSESSPDGANGRLGIRQKRKVVRISYGKQHEVAFLAPRSIPRRRLPRALWRDRDGGVNALASAGCPRSQDGVQVLVPQNLVREPVEDVEEEKAEGEDGSRDGVDPFGAVDEAAADLEQGVARGQRFEHGRRLGQGTVSGQVDVQTETGQEDILVVLS